MADKYVDPSLGTDTGAGTSGDPWGAIGNEIQRMMNLTTQGAAGDTCHVKSTGTVDFSGTDLSFATYGATSNEIVLSISGYTSSAWDSGRGSVNLNGGSTFVAAGVNGIHLQDLDISGGTSGVSFGGSGTDYCMIFNCEFDGGDTVGGVSGSNYMHIVGCYFTAMGGTAIVTGAVGGEVLYNYCVHNDNTRAISAYNIKHNIVKITHTGSVEAISPGGDGAIIQHNTIYSSVAATAQAIEVGATSEGSSIIGNYIEGYSGAGGDAIEIVAGSVVPVIRNNRWFNCTNGLTTGGEIRVNTDNSAATVSGLIDAANDDFRPTAELIGKSWPSGYLGLSGNPTYFDIGAIQSHQNIIIPRPRRVA
jgi:hypothetical protein